MLEEPKINPMQRSKTPSRRIAICVSGCALLILVMVGISISATRSSLRAFAQSDRIARQFLQDVDDNKIPSAYVLTSDGCKDHASLEDLRTYANRYREATGTVANIAAKGHWIWTGTEGTHVSRIYYIQGSRTVQQVSFVFSQAATGYKIDYFGFTPRPSMSSPLVLDRR